VAYRKGRDGLWHGAEASYLAGIASEADIPATALDSAADPNWSKGAAPCGRKVSIAIITKDDILSE